MPDDMKKSMDFVVKIITKWKPKMIEKKLTKASCNCDLCECKDTVILQLSPKKHRGGYPMTARCKTEGCGFMFME